MKAAVIIGMLAALLAGNASATELRDAELVAGASSVLENGSGTVRLEDARLGRIGKAVLVPEPGAPWQVGSAIGVLALLAGRRRRHGTQNFDRVVSAQRGQDSRDVRRAARLLRQGRRRQIAKQGSARTGRLAARTHVHRTDVREDR